MPVSERGITPTSIKLKLSTLSQSDNDNIVSRRTVMRREYSCIMLSTTFNSSRDHLRIAERENEFENKFLYGRNNSRERSAN